MRTIKTAELDEVLATEKYRESREEYMARKEEEGYKIFLPGPNELLLDIDDQESFEEFKIRFGRLSDEIYSDGGGLPSYEEFNSKTEGHKHICVTMPFEVNNIERICLQALLGSDHVREILSLFRYWRKDPHPTLLARKEETDVPNR